MREVELVVGGSKVQAGLDRMVLGIPYPKLSKHDAQTPPSQDELADIATMQKEFHASMKHIGNMIKVTGNHHVSNTQNKDLKRYKALTDDGSLICIFTLGFSFGTGVINLEINPSKMTQETQWELIALLTVSFDGGYQEFYESCVVSHAEFYVDVPGADLSRLVLIDEGRRTTTKHKSTTYHGRRESHLVGTMYDKAKQLKQGGQLVRTETRIKRRDIKLKGLVEHDLFNPFSTFLVVDVIQMQLLADKLGEAYLANQIKELGLYESVKNKHARKTILAHLKEVAVPWWQPELFWAAHRELLLQFKPGHAGGFA